MQDKYAVAFDHMLEGCQVIGPDYRYLYVNKAVAEQGRTTKSKLIGKTMSECYPGIEDTKMFPHLQYCMEHRVVQKMENEFTFPDGSKGWFELRMEPIPGGVLILSVDITEQKQKEIHRQELDDLKNVFIELVSHQLRTPLATMRWGVENILNGKSRRPRADLGVVYSSILEIIFRLDDMITTLNIAEKNVAFHKKNTTIDEVWDPVYKDFMARAHKQQVTINVLNTAGHTELNCDTIKIRTAMTKLVDNSLLYTKPKGKISVKLTSTPKNLRFEVSDNGIGVPQDVQGQIFTRFFRAPNAMLTTTRSSGVGLTIAKYYIEQHGGHLGFKSKENHGSTFWFEIPL